MRTPLLLALLLTAAVTESAAGLDITFNLLHAQKGSWIRSNQADNHSYTEHVMEVDADAVTIQIIHMHRDSLKYNKRVRIPVSYIVASNVNPNSPDARSDTLQMHGRSYAVKVLRARSERDNADVEYYISDEIPVSGVLKKDVFRDNGPARITTTVGAYGSEPDDAIERAGPPDRNGNAEFGIPES